MLKYRIPYDLDSPERTLYHKELIQRKKFLRRLYEQWYGEFLSLIKQHPQGTFVELGAGGGFLKKLAPQVISTDIIDLPDNDRTFSALDMPLPDASADGLFMIDTLHHLPDVAQFMAEVQRVLKTGGQLRMIEPANSAWGRFIYKHFHHEPFEPTGDWTIPASGPLSGANGALPWIVFERDQQRLQNEYPQLRIERLQYRNPLLYLVSGGVSFRQLLPDCCYGLVHFFDQQLPKISRQLSMFVYIAVSKQEK